MLPATVAVVLLALVLALPVTAWLLSRSWERAAIAASTAALEAHRSTIDLQRDTFAGAQRMLERMRTEGGLSPEESSRRALLDERRLDLEREKLEVSKSLIAARQAQQNGRVRPSAEDIGGSS